MNISQVQSILSSAQAWKTAQSYTWMSFRVISFITKSSAPENLAALV